MRLQRRTHSKQWILVAVIVLALLGAGAAWYIIRLPDRSSTVQPQRTTKQTSVHQPAVRETQVHIGQQRIVARQEDYESDDSLWRLVNKSHPLSDPHYTPRELTKAPITPRSGLRSDEQSLRSVLVPDLQALVGAAARDGVTLTLGSGYRSPELQQYFFDNYAARDGVEAANKYSALPGQSEHQTGLALDFASSDMTCYLEQCFADTPAGLWLAAHAHEYGFILRYTRTGQPTTGYQFEPWHYRYVGKDLARALHTENNMLLEDAWPALLEARDTLRAHSNI